MTEAPRRLFDDRIRESGGTAERALAEVIQCITLLGLSRTDFYAAAAFYGGTALRMLLDRTSPSNTIYRLWQASWRPTGSR